MNEKKKKGPDRPRRITYGIISITMDKTIGKYFPETKGKSLEKLGKELSN